MTDLASPLAAHLPALQVIVPLLTSALVVLLAPRGLAWAAAAAASTLAFGIALNLTWMVLDAGSV